MKILNAILTLLVFTATLAEVIYHGFFASHITGIGQWAFSLLMIGMTGFLFLASVAELIGIDEDDAAE